MRFTTPFATLIACLVLLAACGGGTDQTGMERELQNSLAGELVPAEITGVDCPEDADLSPESQFLCSASVEGEYYEVQVTIIDEQGRFEFERRHAVMNVVNTEVQLTSELSQALGFDIDADCGDSEYLVVSVGNTFQCTLTRAEGGAQRNIEVAVENAASVISWSLLAS